MPRQQQASEFAIHHRDWLMVMANRLCRNEYDAEDLVQDTLFRFIQRFSDLDALPDEQSCSAWLVTTLNHVFLDHCRRRRAQETREQESYALTQTLANETGPASSASPPESYNEVTDEVFAKAVSSLKPQARVVFELYASGMRYADIARILGVQVGTVTKRMHDARMQLRERLSQYIEREGH